jgi:hypothetical protein
MGSRGNADTCGRFGTSDGRPFQNRGHNMPARLLQPMLAVLLCLGACDVRAAVLRQIKVMTDCAPDCSSLESIVETVTRGCETDDARVIALYNFCRYDHYHHAYPSESGGVSALKFINVYGWGLCGGQHTVQAALWNAAGYPWRYRGWQGHTTVEVQYGKRWHYLDTFLKFYTWMPDPANPTRMTVAGQEDILANPGLVTDRFRFDAARKVWYLKDHALEYVGDKVDTSAPAFLVCGDSLPGVVKGIRTSRNSGSPRAWGGIRFDDPTYNTDVDLGIGYSLTLRWSASDIGWYFRKKQAGPRHTCGDKDYRNCPAIGPLLEPYAADARHRTWSSGMLQFNPDLRSKACLGSLKGAENVTIRDGAIVCIAPGKPGRFVVDMASPYVVAAAATDISPEGYSLEVAVDPERRRFDSLDGASLSDRVRGTYAYALRVTFPARVDALSVSSIVQHNQEALPYLAPGRNRITVGVANPGDLRHGHLRVTYAYCPGWRDPSPEELYDSGAELYRGHGAQWSRQPVVVQKTVDRVPCSFDIPVPTPKGKQPVYPRMVFLRREFLGPQGQPDAVPSEPSTPRVGPDEYLADVPVPWLIGTHAPQPRPKAPTRTAVLPIHNRLYCSKSGEVFGHQFIKWLKDDSEAWVLLMDFDTAALPAPGELAAARLVIYVHESHNRAPMQASATALTAPFEPGRRYDFGDLGAVQGWTTVERGDGPGKPSVPPRRYEIDVTRAVRSWCRGEPAHGLGLRITPNRAIDDGWTVRFTPSREKPAELLVESYLE